MNCENIDLFGNKPEKVPGIGYITGFRAFDARQPIPAYKNCLTRQIHQYLFHTIFLCVLITNIVLCKMSSTH